MNSNHHQRRHSPAELLSTPPTFSQRGHGPLPAGWENTTLGALGHTSSGGTPSRSDSRFWGGDIPWISSKDMKVARLHDSLEHVTPLALGNGTRLVQPGTILMVVRGMSLAHSFPVAIVEKPVAFNQDLKAFVPNPAVDGEFVLRWLQANQSRLLLLATEASHGTKRIPTGDLLSSHVRLPRLEEQHTIAEALSDIDEMIRAMDALIVKKQAIRIATIQQLTTRKIRLPGFRDSWQKRTFTELFKRLPSKAHQIATTEYDTQGLHPVIDQGKVAVVAFSDRTDQLFKCIPGGVIVFGDHTRVVKFVDVDFLIGADGTQLLTTKVHFVTKFFYYQLLTKGVPDTGYNRHFKFLQDLTFDVPPLSEQEAITTVFSDLDTDIAALEYRRNKAHSIRQGMVQQLLSGRIRLINAERATEHTVVSNCSASGHS